MADVATLYGSDDMPDIVSRLRARWGRMLRARNGRQRLDVWFHETSQKAESKIP